MLVLFLLTILILLFSIVIHEIAHGYAALFLGDTTAKDEGRLTLNPIPHLDCFGSIILPILSSFSGFIFGYAKPIPYNTYNVKKFARYADSLIAVAGPLSNIFLALIFALFINIFQLEGLIAFKLIVFINILLAVINLIPIPPTDGSKIIANFLPYNLSKKIIEFPAHLGFIFFIIFIFLFHKSIINFVNLILNSII